MSSRAAAMKRHTMNVLKVLLYPPKSIADEALRKAFAGKRVVVTGATSGIGEALALRLMRARAKLHLIARGEAKLQALCERAHACGCEAAYTAIDLRDREQVTAFCAELRHRLPEVHCLFCNAGKSICRTVSNAIDRMHDYDRTMDLNYRAMVALTLALAPALRTAGGQMVYTSSVSSLYPSFAGWSAYHASKCAANVWCRTAQREWKSLRVKVKIAYMPLVHTPMSDVNGQYKRLPAYSADEAACILLRLAMSNKRNYKPWWAIGGR